MSLQAGTADRAGDRAADESGECADQPAGHGADAGHGDSSSAGGRHTNGAGHRDAGLLGADLDDVRQVLEVVAAVTNDLVVGQAVLEVAQDVFHGIEEGIACAVAGRSGLSDPQNGRGSRRLHPTRHHDLRQAASRP